MKIWRQYAALAFIVAASAAVAQAAAAAGVTLDLRADDRNDAAIVETVQLYKKSYALVIGNDAYTGAWPRLSNAIKDARLVKAALEEKGFEVTFLTDLKSRELTDAFETFFLETGDDPDARLFVWYAGHGYSERGEGYLVPVDAPDTGEGGRFRRAALSLRRMGEYARDAVALHIYAVFDSCFAGTVFNVGRDKPSAAVTRATTRPVRQFLTSGDAGQSVSDDGTFRKIFLRAISGEVQADGNRDGYLSASEIGLFMTNEITNYSNGLQTPRSGKLNDPDLNQGDFIFSLGKRPAGAAAPPLGQADKETLFWQSVAGSNDRAMYQAYLDQYPNGAFATLAQLKLRNLGSTEPTPPKPPGTQGQPKSGNSDNAVFKDCDVCPEMVVVPAGSFRMGHDKDYGIFTAKPARDVSIGKTFAMGRFEVTYDEYDAFTADTGRTALPDKGLGRGRRPIVQVSRSDALAYMAWLREKTGFTYRFPTEAEWEYAARGGTSTAYWWGSTPSHDRANYGSGAPGWLAAGATGGRDEWTYTAPVGSFPPNPFGLFDMTGNVWEQVADCFHDNYDGAPVNASARGPAPNLIVADPADPPKECASYVLRGGSWGYVPEFMMSASRIGVTWATAGFLHYGLRVVRELE